MSHLFIDFTHISSDIVCFFRQKIIKTTTEAPKRTEFHVKQEINKAVLKAVAQVRCELEKTETKRSKRGRPTTKEEKAQVRKNERIQAKIGVLFAV